jgi:hypothetical protein
MLHVVPVGAFGSGFDLLDEFDRLVAEFRRSMLIEDGQIVVGTERWLFRPDGRRQFLLDRLDRVGEIVATASKTSLRSNSWEVEAGSQRYELVRAGRFTGAWELRGRGQTLGRVAPFFGFIRPPVAKAGDLPAERRELATADLPAELAPPVMAFVVAVVLALRRLARSGAGGATAGG